MKKILLVSSLITAVVGASPLIYAQKTTHYDDARVLHSRPIVEVVRVPETREECWDERVTTRARGSDSKTPVIVGGIVGGVLGNQVGSGGGKTAATVAGTLLGASVASDINRDSRAVTRTHQRCQTVNVGYTQEKRINGYKVTYMYNGIKYTTNMATKPGSKIRIRVVTSITPIERR